MIFIMAPENLLKWYRLKAFGNIFERTHGLFLQTNTVLTAKTVRRSIHVVIATDVGNINTRRVNIATIKLGGSLTGVLSDRISHLLG